MEKRAQGRPSRVAGIVGRTKIIEDMRTALRSVDGLQISRKCLAQAIGVTPALITYYFPDQETLIEELSVPVIEKHRIALSGIVNRQDRHETKMRDIVTVLYQLYGKDRRLYELYKEMEERYPDDYAETSTMTSILSTFFSGRDGVVQADSFEAIVLQGAVRRMCEFAELVNWDDTMRTASPAMSETPSWFGSICCLFASSGSALSPGLGFGH